MQGGNIMKKCIALVLLVIFALAGTASAAGLDFGVVLPTREETRWLGDEADFLAAIEEHGYSAQILFSQKDSATEKANVETLISKGAKAIVLCAFDAAAAAAAVEIAHEEGIPVIAYDRIITGTDKLAYYTTFDSAAVGRAQGEFLVSKLEAGKKGNNLYLYSGALTDNNSFLYFESAWQVLQPLIADGTFIVRNCDKAVEYKDKYDLSRDEMVEIMSVIDTEWTMSVCKTLAEAHLTAAAADAKGEVFVLGPADDDCARALSDSFHADGEVTKVWITGCDGIEASVQYIIDGKQSMTVYKDPKNLVDATLVIIDAILEGKAPETNAVYSNDVIDVPSMQCPVVTVTTDNIAEIFFEGGVYDGSKFVNWQ
jgi:putative multiple sugar transport system substrate-binding protein